MDIPSVYKEMSSGEVEFGLELKLHIGRPLTDNDQRSIYRAVDKLKEDLYIETCKVDPKKLVAKEQWVNALFKALLSAGFSGFSYQEVPNEYSSYLSYLPWMIIGVNDSFFKIGWRKHVIVIDWTNTKIEQLADQLFPQENVTKAGKMIHAWGYGKAKEYLQVLHVASRSKQEVPFPGDKD